MEVLVTLWCAIAHDDFVSQNNILVSAAGKPFIADFGLSKLQEEVSFVACSVQQGSLRWSAPELIAPELIGLETAPASMESDSWSFGMLCLELLTGFPPFAQVCRMTCFGYSTESDLPHI